MSPICPKPASTAQNVSSGSWSTIAKTSLPNGLESSHASAGTFTSSTQGGRRRRNGTAPLPVWSSNRARHRLSRTGNRQLNAAIHRIALTQARCHPDARALLAHRKASGDGGMEALRILKRRLSDVVFKAMAADLSLMVAAAAA